MIDFMGKNSHEGNVANYIQSNGRLDIGQLRPFIGGDGLPYITTYKGGDPKEPTSYEVRRINTNATLRRDEWKMLDEAIIPIARSRLRGIEDLRSAGLVYNLGNAMGTTVFEYHDVSDSMEAVVTMDGVTRSPGDRPKFTHKYIPIPIIHVDYEINSRVLASSRSHGNPLDTTSAEHAARKVAEKLESMLFTATSYDYDGGTIYSYLNEPNRNTYSLTQSWDASTGNGELILADVLAMKQMSLNAKHYGPWNLYIPTSYETTIDADYDNTRGNTIRERILAISGINNVNVIDTLPDDTVLLVQMTSDVVRLINGTGIQNVEWGTEGRMVTKYKVMTIQVPQIRADQDGNSGIVHASV